MSSNNSVSEIIEIVTSTDCADNHRLTFKSINTASSTKNVNKKRLNHQKKSNIKININNFYSKDDNLSMDYLRKQRRLAANARERKRMCKLNEAFERLKSVIPTLSNERNLSKFETLQLARTYIAALIELLKR
ncbi:neurogenic differentiation factor 1-like [Condylostylus longicornis]|uniref:neurogenic differentiation factor 1-like n=1 Tax=Condylostylus longicornis TaxID=2530218 RepID=UPI00244E577E|nr:neurogenic differentiation factor 1-like [Condylostylus longicornis]